IASGAIVPTSGATYLNGFAYQTLLASLTFWTGLSLQQIQTVVAPILGLLPVLLVFGLYRELLPTRRMQTLAALLILCQADFLFIRSRGSHEKYTLCLLAMLLIGLARVYCGS